MTIEGIMKYIVYMFFMGIPIFTVWIAWRMYDIKKRPKVLLLKNEVMLWLFIFYMICLYTVTVFRWGLSLEKIVTRPYGLDNINLIPLVELLKLWGYGYWWSFTYNIIGNIVWFVPLGFLLPLLKRKWRWGKVVATGALVSLSIEVMQFIFVTGITDVDDLIFNTIGTLVGYLCYKIVYRGYCGHKGYRKNKLKKMK